MSLIELIKNNGNRESSLDKTLANSLSKLVDMLSEITEFSQNELKALSILQTDKYFKEFLSFFVVNKKNLKRKHAEEILRALEEIGKCVSANASNQAINLMEQTKK